MTSYCVSIYTLLLNRPTAKCCQFFFQYYFASTSLNFKNLLFKTAIYSLKTSLWAHRNWKTSDWLDTSSHSNSHVRYKIETNIWHLLIYWTFLKRPKQLIFLPRLRTVKSGVSSPTLSIPTCEELSLNKPSVFILSLERDISSCFEFFSIVPMFPVSVTRLSQRLLPNVVLKFYQIGFFLPNTCKFRVLKFLAACSHCSHVLHTFRPFSWRQHNETVK